MGRNKREIAVEALLEASKDWPEVFPRSAVPELTGGLYSVGYLANLDSKSLGPGGSFNARRKKVYLKKNFVNWMVKRMEV